MLFFRGAQGRNKGEIGTNQNVESFTQTRKNFTSRVTEHWDRLPRAVVESPLKIFKTLLDIFLCNLL